MLQKQTNKHKKNYIDSSPCVCVTSSHSPNMSILLHDKSNISETKLVM